MRSEPSSLKKSGSQFEKMSCPILHYISTGAQLAKITLSNTSDVPPEFNRKKSIIKIEQITEHVGIRSMVERMT